MARYYSILLVFVFLTLNKPAIAGKDFIKKDMRKETTELVQAVGSRLSDKHLTLVVYGGNKKLLMAAYRVAQKLDEEGVSVAFLLAPDRDNIDITMHVDYWTDGFTKYFSSIADNDKTDIRQAELNMLSHARKAREYALKKSD